MVTIASAEKALKEYYLDAVTQQLNGNVSPFFNAIEKNSEDVAGKDVNITVVKGDLVGVSAVNEDANLPNAKNNKYYGIKLPLKNLYGVIEISDKVMRASAGSSNAAVSVLNTEMDALVKNAKASLARMLYGDGNGFIGRIIEKVNNNTVRVDNIKEYYLGVQVKLIDSTNGTHTARITAIDEENKTISVEGDISSKNFTNGGTLTVSVTAGCELTGLAAIFDSDILYGYNKTEESYFAPKIKHLAPSELTEDELVQMIDKIAAGGGNINMILCDHKLRNRIAKLMTETRRTVNTTDIAAGYSSILINDVPVYADIFCPSDKIYFLNTDDFVLSQLCDWSWLEDENGNILYQVSKKAAYGACLVKYAELVCKRPCGQGAIYLDRPESHA